MIELKVVEDQRPRAVVNKLGALVEERTVVLIGFDHKEGLSPRRADTSKLPGTPPMTKPGL